MTNALTPTENSNKKSDDTILNATKNLIYTTTADWPRTVKLSNDSHPTGVVKTVCAIQTFPLTSKLFRRNSFKMHLFFYHIMYTQLQKKRTTYMHLL